MTSIPAWSIGITTFGRIWVHYTFIIYGPSYMKTILGFSIQKVCFFDIFFFTPGIKIKITLIINNNIATYRMDL